MYLFGAMLSFLATNMPDLNKRFLTVLVLTFVFYYLNAGKCIYYTYVRLTRQTYQRKFFRFTDCVEEFTWKEIFFPICN